uniref:FAM124 domain-containing protein n=1 Tax=Callorhinchus milii TaxID=7868 RepID=A0A4W3I0W1_CALMI
MPCTQDFFSLADGMPLWAIRQMHYGKEIIRYTIYCSFDHFEDMVALYKVILAHKVSYSKSDFCYFTLYSTSNTDLQLSFKKLPKDMFPTPTESTILEFRVQELAQVVAMLPKPCSPISDIRWQTEDYDGNKILLQVRSTDCLWRKCSKMHRSVLRMSPAITRIANSPDQHCAFERNWNCGLQPASRHQQTTLAHKHCDRFKEECFYGDWSRSVNDTSENSWYAQQSDSSLSSHLFTNVSITSALSTPQSKSSFVSCNKDESARDSFGSRINIVDLEDAEETDVDTGLKTFHSDLSIVSAYAVPDVQDKSFRTTSSSAGHPIRLPDSTMRMSFFRSKPCVLPTGPLCQLLKRLSPTDIQPHLLPLHKHLSLKYETTLSSKEEEFYI